MIVQLYVVSSVCIFHVLNLFGTGRYVTFRELMVAKFLTFDFQTFMTEFSVGYNFWINPKIVLTCTYTVAFCEMMDTLLLMSGLLVFVLTSFRYFLQEKTSAALWSAF